MSGMKSVVHLAAVRDNIEDFSPILGGQFDSTADLDIDVVGVAVWMCLSPVLSESWE
jgi:hypothetical protein